MSDERRANGFIADAGTLTVEIAGREYFGLTQIGEYKASREQKILFGYGGLGGPRGRTRGHEKAPETTTIEGPLSTMRELYAALAAAAPRRGDGSQHVGDVEFTITYVYRCNGNVYTDVLSRCSATGWATKPPAADSPDAVLDTTDIQPLRITRNGKPL
jgi:hypothetical protein